MTTAEPTTPHVEPPSAIPLRRPLRASRRAINSTWSPVEVLLGLRQEPGLFGLIGSWLGSEAVISSRPVLVHSSDDGTDPFHLLEQGSALTADSEPAHGVFGGWVGYLGYSVGAMVERLPPSPPRPHPLPDWRLAWHDQVLRRDPDTGWWFESLSTPETEAALDARFRYLSELLGGTPPAAEPVSCDPFVATPAGDDHKKAIGRTLDLIAAGDIYQANICLRLSSHLHGSAIDLFARGVEALAPPFAGYLDVGGDRCIASLSPEQFLQRCGDRVRTLPIKGTWRSSPPGSGQHGVDDPARAELIHSDKDRAENVMIVDLMRNDLGRVCVPGSIRVPRLFDVEAHPGLWHLVSEVTGQLEPGVGDGSLLRATFPPGSVTGAPKVRAMEVIAEVEATGREAYTGTIGMVSPSAGSDWNVAIRTFEVDRSDIWLGVGGGIVAESDPTAELTECLTKALPIVQAVGSRIDLLDTPTC